jgi:hypothetical protein
MWLRLDSGEILLAGTSRPNTDGFGDLVHEAPRNGPRVDGCGSRTRRRAQVELAGVPISVWVG